MSTGALQLRSRFRAVTDHTVTVLAVVATILVIVPLAVIFAELIYKGLSSLNWDFFTKVPAPEGETGGGMANAIVGSAVLLGVASGIMSAGVKFKQIFAIGCYAGLTGIIAKILGIVVMFLKSPDQFNLMNPLAFNPAAFMDPKTTSKFLYTIASGCDLFIFWAMLLTAIGLKAAAGKRLSFGGALFAVALPWAFFLLVGASIAGAFS